MKIIEKIKDFLFPKNNLIWEEISERKTTKMWYFLLFCMFICIFYTAINSLSLINDFFEKAKKPNSNLQNIVNTLDFKWENIYSDYYYNSTSYFEQEIDEETWKEISKASNIFKKIENLNYEKDIISQKIFEVEEKNRKLQKEYEISLTEKIAWVSDESQKIKDEINQNQKDISDFEIKKTKVEEDIFTLKKENSTLYEKLKTAFEKQNEKYKNDALVYKISVKATSFLFIFVIFLVLFKIYSRLKSKNSSYTIIFSVATFAYGLILVWLFLNFFWSLIPEEFLSLIYDFFETFEIFLLVLQFIWPVLIMWFFGFFVYKIQKKLYSKENILKRILRDKKCPNCSNSIDTSKNFCPFCAYEILETCPHCSEKTVTWVDFCYNCWKKKS